MYAVTLHVYIYSSRAFTRTLSRLYVIIRNLVRLTKLLVMLVLMWHWFGAPRHNPSAIAFWFMLAVQDGIEIAIGPCTRIFVNVRVARQVGVCNIRQHGLGT